MRLWVEHACQTLAGTDTLVPPEGSKEQAVCTFQSEERFFVALVDWPQGEPEGGGQARRFARSLAAAVEQGGTLDEAIDGMLPTLPTGRHVSVAALQIVEGCRAALVECDAPPLFLTRRGELVLLPVQEEEIAGRLVRRCHFSLQAGDYLALVSEAYIRARGWDRRWGWRDIALSMRRLTETGGDAEQLLKALVRMYRRLARGEPERSVAVVAMRVRPLRRAVVWSGPPANPAEDTRVVERLMAEEGTRIICGDTTARIAARVLGRELEQEPRPAEGWAEVPPTKRLEGVDLVTEGLVTMQVARRRLQEAERPADLPRRTDGATRLARLLWQADVVHFLVGLAVNPAQAADSAGQLPLRRIVVEQLAEELRRKGKVVRIEYLG